MPKVADEILNHHVLTLVGTKTYMLPVLTIFALIPEFTGEFFNHPVLTLFILWKCVLKV